MEKRYDHQTIEKKWQAAWESGKVWEAGEKKGTPKFYVLDMFPYPSAQGLHVGHPEGYTASDIEARYLRMRGYDVLHPMGFDSFGLPAENFAIKTGTHPAATTIKNIKAMRAQIKRLGFSYDWSREVITSDPAYYRWTQWIFVQLFKRGLAYEADAPINWCPSCKTGLANEEVVDGKCERCGTGVTKKQIKQWLVKITDERYIERLQNDLDQLDWPESIKLLQKNWIGRSEGAEVDFAVAGSTKKKKLAVIVHGSPSQAGYPDPTVQHWLPWMAVQLERMGFHVAVPALPRANAPVYGEWKRAFEKSIKGFEIDEDAVLIGHSAGTSFLVRYLSEQKKKVSRLVLVAPSKVVVSADSEHHQRLRELYNFKAQYGIADKVLVLYSADDKESVSVTAKFYKDFYKADVQQFADRGHFTAKDGVRELPEALKWIRAGICGPISEVVRVFTTRPDTLFGATYLVLSPEHPLVSRITTLEQKKEVDAYVHKAAAKSDLERTDLAKQKTGVFTGAYAANPVNNAQIPIWIADYVLASYGTGAIMAVPAHDERDFEFATKFNLAIIQVIKQPGVMPPRALESFASPAAAGHQQSDLESKCWTGDGTMVHSGEYDGMDSVEFKKKITAWLEKNGKGKASVNYKLRDWLFSRQRYWGEPIPVVHCEKCGQVAVPEKQLPVKLPNVKKYKPTGTGESPLAAITKWVHTKCPVCGGKAQRETNTMPQWAGSNWYWLRYCDPHNGKKLADPKKLKAWLPVDLYVGGAEHAVLHLLYARFIYKFLCDINVIPSEVIEKYGDEPFKKLKNQGLILGEDGVKMSKSRGNVINPDDVVERYGADTLRMYEMFMGPFEDKKPWSTEGIKGVSRFLNKLWNVAGRVQAVSVPETLERYRHRMVKKITDDIESFSFNTAVSTFMQAVNTLHTGTVVPAPFLETLLVILSPFAPHIAEELWQRLGHAKSIAYEKWPQYDEKALKAEKVTIVVQVNGKVRDTIIASADATEENVKKTALMQDKIKKYIARTPKKIIFVKNRLINFVV
ncbi:MAG: leucine--tRNA ligase [Patescibacteria group bacterium]